MWCEVWTARTILKLPVFLLPMALVWGLSMPSHDPPVSGLMEKCPRVPVSVRPILARACLDCHSNQTRWPWYSHMPLVSSMVHKDVEKARKRLDFSGWTGDISHVTTANEAQDICDEVSDGAMPPLPYKAMHSDARLSQSDKDTLCKWADGLRAQAK